MSFSDWPWRHWCARQADKPALRLNEETLTWQQLCDRVDRLATGFHRQGVQEGDGVMLGSLVKQLMSILRARPSQP